MRRLPADLGGAVFPASLEGGTKFLRLDPHKFDPWLTRFAADYVKPGQSVWDIGGNVGLFSFAAAGLAGPEGHVVSVEADTWLAGNLRTAALKNTNAAPVAVVPVAISDRDGIVEFHIAQSNRATNYLGAVGGSNVTGGVREIQYVPTTTLDALLEWFPPPDVLKIDVEGAEVLVLRGADRVLNHRPVILLEVYEAHENEADQILSGHGYGYLDLETRKPRVAIAHNVICVPTR